MKTIQKLSFTQLSKIYIAGFVGYSCIICILFLSLMYTFPSFIRSRLDMSPNEFFRVAFIYFGVFGLIANPLMLIGSWIILRLLKNDETS